MIIDDKINMEYEARVMISEAQYQLVKSDYLKCPQTKREFVNTNTYFDYQDLRLTNKHVVLRTRSINDKKFELTLKKKGTNGDLEINHPLTYNEYMDIINHNLFPSSKVIEELDENIDALIKIVSLKTERLEVEFDDYLFVVDKNHYRDRIDYNLEVEAKSKTLAESYLIKICEHYNIEYKKDYISKSRRTIYNL